MWNQCLHINLLLIVYELLSKFQLTLWHFSWFIIVQFRRYTQTNIHFPGVAEVGKWLSFNIWYVLLWIKPGFMSFSNLFYIFTESWVFGIVIIVKIIKKYTTSVIMSSEWMDPHTDSKHLIYKGCLYCDIETTYYKLPNYYWNLPQEERGNVRDAFYCTDRKVSSIVQFHGSLRGYHGGPGQTPRESWKQKQQVNHEIRVLTRNRSLTLPQLKVNNLAKVEQISWSLWAHVWMIIRCAHPTATPWSH